MSQDSSKTAILRAASTEFCDKGFAGARMASIAERAGVNKALLHYYFKNKEKLYIEVLSFSMSLFWGTVMEQIGFLNEDTDLIQAIETLVQAAVPMMNEEKELRQIIMRELGDSGEHITAMGDSDVCQGPVDSFIDFLAQAEEFKGKDELAPLHFFINLMGMIMNTWHSYPFYERKLHKIGRKFDDAFIQARIEEINKTIRRYFKK